MVVSLSAAGTQPMSAGEVGVVVVSGVLIVFVVLAIIYLALMIMQSAFTKDKKVEACEVTAPFGGTVEYFVATSGRVAAQEVVLVAADSDGKKSEILAPQAGKLKPVAQKGDSFAQGDVLFRIG